MPLGAPGHRDLTSQPFGSVPTATRTRTYVEYGHDVEDEKEHESEDVQENENEHARARTARNFLSGAADGRGVNRPPLDFEKLDVYRLAIEFLGLAVRIMARMPRGQADLRDQLRRASTSIPLNIAEASGKRGSSDRAQSHAIARGSALECAAILDVLAMLGLAPASAVEQGKRLLSRIVAMLSKMCRS